MRRVEAYLEEDIVVNGSVTERSCQLPPDVRCTIAVAASSDGERMQRELTICKLSVHASCSSQLAPKRTLTRGWCAFRDI
eukprot:1174087-Rhodomonas_salina.1